MIQSRSEYLKCLANLKVGDRVLYSEATDSGAVIDKTQWEGTVIAKVPADIDDPPIIWHSEEEFEEGAKITGLILLGVKDPTAYAFDIHLVFHSALPLITYAHQHEYAWFKTVNRGIRVLKVFKS